MSNSNSNRPELFIDNERYDWEKASITAEELRTLGAIPVGVQIFLKRPGQPDVEVVAGMVIDLTSHPAPERFSTQAVGSQAG